MTTTGDLMLPALDILIMRIALNREAELRFFRIVALQRGQRGSQRRTGLGTGISFRSMEIDIRSRSARFEIAAGTDLLRVMISKSLNLTCSVTVRPRLSNDLECNRALAHVRVWTFFKPVLLSASVPFEPCAKRIRGMRHLHPSFVNPRTGPQLERQSPPLHDPL